MKSGRSASHSFSLRRRGVDHGRFSAPSPGPADAPLSAEFLARASEAWAADEPIVVRGAVAAELRRWRRDIERALAGFAGLRRGESFEQLVARRIARCDDFRPAGVTIDLGDTREIEKVFVDGLSSGRAVARDLYAKLSWIAFDERDTSLRIRFSFGAEALLDWQKETRRARWSERFAQVLFPECEAITSNAALTGLIERMVGRKARLGERIVYNNAPGGGATFHHDDEPGQLGVVYTQLEGSTAWFALPKRRLARHVAAAARSKALKQLAGTPARALRALDDTADPHLGKLLNATPSFTRRLAAEGALRVLRAGDSVLLPSHGPDDVCWHAVFALGSRPSLSHSYGIFFAQRESKAKPSTIATRSRETPRTSARSRDAR
jgi:hypothetical protein